MTYRPRRASIWKLLLPVPLAVSIAAMVGLEARRVWQMPTRSAAPATSVATPDGARRCHERRAPSSARGKGEDARVEPSSGRADVTESTVCGPAPRPVAPSFEAALRSSIPPPAVASAPDVAPAPLVPLSPAPEPGSAERTSPIEVTEPRVARAARPIRSVRFDAGYYYDRGLTAEQLAEQLAEQWARQGVNLVYFYAYNTVYGARYRTEYATSIMEDYGRQDLLGHMIRAAHERGIRVVAWINGAQHKQAWQSHPSWRAKSADGTDYRPGPDSYPLCVRNPEVLRWWAEFLDDLLQRYPGLDGIDLAEFQVDRWGDHACHCEHCRAQFAAAREGAPIPGAEWRSFRARGLTQLIHASSRLAHSYGKEVHVTSVFTAGRDGGLMSSAQVRDAIGFDLDGVLAGPDSPDVVQAELIWQQWAATYGDRETFGPEWTRAAVRQAKEMIGGRARMVAHIEVTDFGAGGLDGSKLARTIASASLADPAGIDIYDAHQLEQTEGVSAQLRVAWLGETRE